MICSVATACLKVANARLNGGVKSGPDDESVLRVAEVSASRHGCACISASIQLSSSAALSAAITNLSE
jgi:hypothetical protein